MAKGLTFLEGFDAGAPRIVEAIEEAILTNLVQSYLIFLIIFLRRYRHITIKVHSEVKVAFIHSNL